MSYIDTRANIASYKVSQIPVHFNFKNYVVNTTSAQFQKLLETAKTYEFDRDIETLSLIHISRSAQAGDGREAAGDAG